MYKYHKFEADKAYFYPVALGFILIGATIFALGGVEWLFNYFGDYSFHNPLAKFIAGIVVMGIGYIHLELEMIRTKK